MADLNDKIAGAKLKTYDLYKDGVFLGLAKKGSTSAKINGRYVPLEVDQVVGEAKATLLGFPIMIETEIYDTTVDFLASIMAGQAESDTNGTSSVLHLGNELKESQEFVGEFLMHPSGVALSDKSYDILIPYGYAKIEELTLLSSQDEYQSVKLTIVSQPDLNKSASKVYGSIGDWSLDSETPFAVVVHADKMLKAPYKPMSAGTIGVGGVDRLRASAIMAADNNVTAAVNNGAGYSATATSIAFDGLSSNEAIQVGDILIIDALGGAEKAYVSAVTYATASTGTLTLVRGVCGTTAISIVDNDTIDVYTSISVIERCTSVAWASSDATKATVGNTYAGVGAANKGTLTGVATGSTNITATYNAIASENFAVTVP